MMKSTSETSRYSGISYLDLATGHGIGTYETYLSIELRKINEMLMNHVLRNDRKIIKASLDSRIVKSIVTLSIIFWYF
ncbi:ATP synthase subunit alpha [Gossypium arboreum]|uniref:ATP synthase subunit alpha n=1 Tax=Gossypium arboreum TaxID=29729 RepID=A0A0B0PW47_GOSAR|nr:ATP synthase subunit alpha [Gossypium arboreum]